jgi:hypothetical protein
MSETVRVTNDRMETDEFLNVSKVFFINPATHSDAVYLCERESPTERVLFVNAALALTVELN